MPLSVDSHESVFSTSDFDEVCARCSTGHLRDGNFQDIRTNGKPVCEEPPTGTTAESSGTTVATLTLEKGYYRISHQRHDILKCYQPDACVGGNDAATYCAPGYNGPCESATVGESLDEMKTLTPRLAQAIVPV